MLLDGSLFSVFRIVPTLKSAMENGSLCQVLLNKDFFQYGCNRVHLSSSSYVVMVARIVTQKRQGLAPTSFFTSPFCATRNFTVPYNFGFPNPLFQTRKKRFSITAAAFCLTTENECRRDMISISQNFSRCSHCSKSQFFV